MVGRGTIIARTGWDALARDCDGFSGLRGHRIGCNLLRYVQKQKTEEDDSTPRVLRASGVDEKYILIRLAGMV